MTSHNYIIGFLKYYQHLLIEPTLATTRHRRVPRISFWRGKTSALKSHDHESESNKKIKIFFSKITHLSPCQTG